MPGSTPVWGGLGTSKRSLVVAPPPRMESRQGERIFILVLILRDIGACEYGRYRLFNPTDIHPCKSRREIVPEADGTMYDEAGAFRTEWRVIGVNITS